MSDDEFVGPAEAVIVGIDGELAAHDARLARTTEELLDAFSRKYRSWLCREMTNNQAIALQAGERLKAHLASLRKEYDLEVENRAKEAKIILAEIDRSKKLVRRYNVKTDIIFGHRQKLIAGVNRYLDNRMAAHLEDHMLSLLSGMEEIALNLANEAAVSHATMKTLRINNTKQKFRPGWTRCRFRFNRTSKRPTCGRRPCSCRRCTVSSRRFATR
jgi:hypothetical protein